MRYLLSLFVVMLVCASAVGQTAEIKRLKNQQRVLQEQIANTNKLYLDVKKQTTSILDRINLINQQIEARKELIASRESEIKALQEEQMRLQKEIDKLNQELKEKQASYAKAIKGMLNNKYSRNKFFFVFSGKSIGESVRRMQYLKDYSHYRRSQAEEIKKKNAEIMAKRDLLKQAEQERLTALEAIKTEQLKLQQEEQLRQQEVAAAKGQEAQLRKTLQDQQRKANQLNAQIERLIAEEVARVQREEEARKRAALEERRRKAAEEAAKAKKKSSAKKRSEKKTDDEAKTAPSAPTPRPRVEHQDEAVITETFKLSKNFASNKGRLPMPVTGRATIVGNFGQRKHSEWNVTTNSNGIDIRASKGASIRAVFDGEVSKVFSFAGSQTCVIVRHGEYYTFYDNVYDLFVKQGDKVKAGQALGRIYTDPDTGVAKMHFQLWHKTTKVNPAPWLAR